MKSIIDWFTRKTTKITAATEEAIDLLPTSALDLRNFALQFFTQFESEVQASDRRKLGPLQVTLSPTLAEHFGRSQLRLVFQTADLGAGSDLIAYGSRTFDQILAWLERRSAVALQKLPTRQTGSEALLQAIRPINASISNLKMQEQSQFIFAFDWRITYRADDKREELFTVILDESGSRLLQPNDRSIATTPNQVDFQSLLTDAEPVALETNEEGLQLPPKLPPLTQLVRLAETARKHATYHADVRCINHESEILPRLYKSLNRLTTFYQQQIEELTEGQDPEGDKKQGLEEDLRRKIAEEVENHRLHVQVDLVGYIALQVPVASADITLSDGKREATVKVRRNRYTGALRRPACQHCGNEIERLVLDREGRISCEMCSEQCQTCLELVSGAGSMHTCPVCSKSNCSGCSKACAACGEAACHACIDSCPLCQDSVCHTCQTECAHCSKRQCRNHLRMDSVLAAQVTTLAAQEATPALICPDCTVRCPNCQQFSAQVETCAASGQRFCRNCLVHCQHCSRPVGASFVKISPNNQKPYCPACAKALTNEE